MIFGLVMSSCPEAHPEIELGPCLDGGLAGIVADGSDADIRLGQMVGLDMVFRPLTSRSSMAVVAAPGHLSTHGTPEVPDDLVAHRCIDLRRSSRRTIYHWRFEDAEGGDLHLSASGGPVFNDAVMKLWIARARLGLAYEVRVVVEPDIADGRPVLVRKDHLPAITGFHVYFPPRAQVMLKLRVFIDHAVAVLAKGG